MSRPFYAIHFQKQKEKPLFAQLAEQLKRAVIKGAFLQNGDQLISLREMKKISGGSLETDTPSSHRSFSLIVTGGAGNDPLVEPFGFCYQPLR